MATLESLRARHVAIAEQYATNLPFVREVQQRALDELLPVLEDELELDKADLVRARLFLADPVSVFRFCRRARFSATASLALLHATLSFRLVSLSNLSPTLLSPLYLTQPLFFFHPALHDRFGRPCAVLNLRHVTRTEDGELDGLKEFIRMGWEVGRRWMADSSRADEGDDVPSEAKVQMVVIVDLEGAGMSNLEVELLPFFMDLLKSHFPGMVGAIYVLNYGWMYAGMWQLAKRILPNTALERILFPTKPELLQFFEKEHLLVEHGGTVEYTYTPANPILEKYCRPLPASSVTAYPSPSPSPHPLSPLSRTTSLETMSDVFHSIAPTPHATRPPTPILGPGTLARRPSGLSMTTLSRTTPLGSITPRSAAESAAGLWRTASSSSLSNLRRIPSISDFTLHLAETQAAIEGDSSGEDEDEEEMAERERAAREYARQMAEAVRQQQAIRLGHDDSGGPLASTSTSTRTSAQSSRVNSRANSRNVSRTVSRDSSPARRDHSHGTFASRAVKFSDIHPLPYAGYSAVPSLDPAGVLRPHLHRRRKRDLVRTLTYLAVLRFLALRRQIKKYLVTLIQLVLRLTGLERVGQIGAGTKKKTSIRWEEEAGENSGTSRAGRTTPRRRKAPMVIYAVLLLGLIRSGLLAKLGRVVLQKLPDGMGLGSMQDCSTLLGPASGAGLSTGRVSRKRDVLRRMLGLEGKGFRTAT